MSAYEFLVAELLHSRDENLFQLLVTTLNNDLTSDQPRLFSRNGTQRAAELTLLVKSFGLIKINLILKFPSGSNLVEYVFSFETFNLLFSKKSDPL